MLKLFFLPFLLLSMLVITACQSLPPGTPPEGPIVSIENKNDAVNNEQEAIEKMVTALATSEPISNANPIAHLIMDKVNVQMEYFSQGTSITSNVYRELVATGVADGFTDDNSSDNFVLTSTLIKLKTMENNDILFKWSMSIKKENSSESLFTYSLKVLLKPLELCTKNIDKEEITPIYK